MLLHWKTGCLLNYKHTSGWHLRSFTSLSSNLLPLSDFSPYQLGNISQTHHLLPVRVTLLNLFLPSGIPNPSLPVKCYASSKTLPQRLSSNTQKPSWFFSNQIWSLSITVCIIYSTNIYWRLPMSQVVCLTLNINIYYNSTILMGMLSFKKKTEFAKVLFRIQMQILLILNPSSVHPILKLPSGQMAQVPISAQRYSCSPAHQTPRQCSAAGEQTQVGPQFCFFLPSLPGFLCSRGKNPSLPSSQTEELSLAQQSRQIPLNRLQWQTPGAWSAGCGCWSSWLVQRKELGKWLLEIQSSWKKEIVYEVNRGNPKEMNSVRDEKEGLEN